MRLKITFSHVVINLSLGNNSFHLHIINQNISIYTKAVPFILYLLAFNQLLQHLIKKGFAGFRFLSHVHRIQGSSKTSKQRLQRALFNHMFTKCDKKTFALYFELMNGIILYLAFTFQCPKFLSHTKLNTN